MAFKAIDQSNRFNYGRSHYNMAFFANDQSNRLPKFRKASLSRQIFLLTIRPDVRLGVQGR